MNVVRMFASAIVRRLAVLLIGGVLAWAGCDAKAQVAGCPGNSTPGSGTGCGTQGGAYSSCMAAAASYTGSKSAACEEVRGTGSWRYYACTRSGSSSGCNGFPYYYFPATALCSAQAPQSGGYYRLGSTANSCTEGCVFSPAAGASTSQQVIAGVTYLSTSQRVPTGDVCSANDGGGGTEVTEEECHTQGNLTQCIRPDGKHCAQASTGKRFCWSPSEAGTKQEGNEGATKSPTGTAINPPKNPPPNGGDWTSTGSGGMSNTSGGTTNNYTITNWNSSYGNTGNGGGSTNPDGSENGNGDGDGDGEDDGNGPGPSTGESLGDLYTPTEDTAASLMQAFFNAAGDTALLSQIGTFFGNCGYAGTCPQWSYETDFTGNMTFAQLCDGTIADILNFAGFCVLAVAAFGAFRIAIY